MKFKDLRVTEKFYKQGSNTEYEKVPERRVSCCKVKCNAKTLHEGKEIVFKPLDEVTKIEN